MVEKKKIKLSSFFDVDKFFVDLIKKRELKVNYTVEKPSGLWLTPKEDYYK